MNASIPRKLLTSDECLKQWSDFQNKESRRAFLNGFKVFFSTVLGGFSRDPLYFTIPIDEHGFHRGDGVFEGLQVVEGQIYLMSEHLDRLERSASLAHLKLPMPRLELEKMCEELVQHADGGSLLIRIYLTRGGGGFGVSPAESSGSQLYAVATRFYPITESAWQKGVSLGVSQVPIKPGIFARIKSLNYLPNVMIKAEALSRGFDYGVGMDDSGSLTEGATENMVCINELGELCHPRFDHILDGCTMKRLFELAAQKNDEWPELRINAEADLTPDDLQRAQEILMVGTSLDVIPVTRFESRDLKVGPWASRFRKLIQDDQKRRR